MEKMNAVVMRGPNEFGLESVPVPVPARGEALVKIRSIAICGSDPKVFSGGYLSIKWPPSFPFIPGHEFAGEVAALGEGAVGFNIGDRVAGEAHCGCGVCANCKKGFYNLCLNYGKPADGHRHYGFTWQGAYADYNAYNTRALTKLPDNVSFDEGSLVDTAGTALQAVRLTGITPGGFSLIIGPGPIGIFAIQIAKALGSRTIIVGRRERLELAGRLGADFMVNYEECGDVVAKVREITGGVGVDEAFECAGSNDSMAQCVKAAKKNGQVALVSLPVTDDHTMPVKTMVMNQVCVHGSRANPNCSKEVIELISTGKINAKDMITHTFPLRQMAEALDTFVQRKDGAMKVVLHPNE